MDPLIGLVGAALTLVGVLVSAYFTKRGSDRKLKQDAGQKMIDQLQEELARQGKEIATLQRVQRIQDDYISQLRRHIADRQEPPPPPWPSSLIT